MKPDPLEKQKPDSLFYLLGSAAGILLTALGAYVAYRAVTAEAPQVHDMDTLPMEQMFWLGIGIVIAGLILFRVAAGFRRRNR